MYILLYNIYNFIKNFKLLILNRWYSATRNIFIVTQAGVYLALIYYLDEKFLSFLKFYDKENKFSAKIDT